MATALANCSHASPTSHPHVESQARQAHSAASSRHSSGATRIPKSLSGAVTLPLRQISHGKAHTSTPTRKDRSKQLFKLAAAASASSMEPFWPSIRGLLPGRQGSQGEDGSSSQDGTPGPSCMFVGPLETADQSSLEEFYRQAKDSYYSGKPLILDDMFDRVEVHLRWLRSPVVQKFPRCSLQSFTTYSDAQEDPSQLSALFSVWGLLLGLGSTLVMGPVLLTLHLGWSHVASEEAALGIVSNPGPVLSSTWFMLCGISMSLGVTLGTLAMSSLAKLRAGDLVAMKGACPACSEEVYAFVKVDGREKRPRHKTDCHVCGQRLAFHAVLRPKPKHQSTKGVPQEIPAAVPPGDEEWVYGRVYAVVTAKDLQPR